MSVGEAQAAPADLFAALGDPTRLALLSRLSAGEPHLLASLAADSRMTRQAVAKHLHILENVGLVSRARVGRESRYGFRSASLDAAQAYLATVSAQWDETLGRLKAMVEK